MGEVAAHAASFTENIHRCLGGARVLIAEGDVVVHEIADRLHPAPARQRRTEYGPRRVRQTVGLAITAAEQEDQALVREVRDRLLRRVDRDRIRLAGIAHDRRGGQLEPARGRHDTAALIAAAVAVIGVWGGGLSDDALHFAQYDIRGRLTPE